MHDLRFRSPVTRVQVQEVTMHFREPFSIAYETVEDASVAFIRITDSKGNEGVGSASPDPEVTGETLQNTMRRLTDDITPDFLNAYPNLQMLHTALEDACSAVPSAQSAIEEATLSLLLRQSGLSMNDLFPPVRSNMTATVTIGICSEDETLAQVQHRLKEGFTSLKVKCGIDVHEDIAKIEKVLGILPPECSLLLDANQGYSLADAQQVLKAFGSSDIALIEQPVAAEDIAGLRTLHQMKSIPVIADESAVGVADSCRLLLEDDVAGVNVKLMKCGGPLNAAHIIRCAQEHGKIVMIGCMYESNVSLTTAAHLALAFDIDVADIDSGIMDFDDDPATGGLCIHNGRVSIGDPLHVSL